MSDKKQVSIGGIGGGEGSISDSAQVAHVLSRDMLYRQFEANQRAVDNDVHRKPLVVWAMGAESEPTALSESQSSLLSPARIRG